MRNIKFLKKAVHEVVTAQHTAFHTAPIYEEDILDEEELEEMSSGGVVGAASAINNKKFKLEIVKKCNKKDIEKDKKWCLYSHKNKLLGRHKTPKDAFAQEKAIQINK